MIKVARKDAYDRIIEKLKSIETEEESCFIELYPDGSFAVIMYSLEKGPNDNSDYPILFGESKTELSKLYSL